jgi:hypothetical protein
MSILAMTIAAQLAEDAIGPLYGSHINRDTRMGRLARAAMSAASQALIRHIGAAEMGEWHYAAAGFDDRIAEARRVALAAVVAEVAYLEEHGA